ncbi:hypothetical protein C8J56DRAFT_1176600 [Mycena floridula]|nr:hypothetical protein C8J56DRAFT_1176600 [Mycena floridula]
MRIGSEARIAASLAQIMYGFRPFFSVKLLMHFADQSNPFILLLPCPSSSVLTLESWREPLTSYSMRIYLPSKENGSSMLFLLAASLSCRFPALLFLPHCLSLCSSLSIFPFNETKRMFNDEASVMRYLACPLRCPSSLAMTIRGYRLAPSLAAILSSTEKNRLSIIPVSLMTQGIVNESSSQSIVCGSTRTNN